MLPRLFIHLSVHTALDLEGNKRTKQVNAGNKMILDHRIVLLASTHVFLVETASNIPMDVKSDIVTWERGRTGPRT